MIIFFVRLDAAESGRQPLVMSGGQFTRPRKLPLAKIRKGAMRDTHVVAPVFAVRANLGQRL